MKLQKIKIPKLVGFFMFIAFLFGAGYLIPWTTVLGKAGLLEPAVANSLQIYSSILFFIVGVIFIYLANYFWKRNNTYCDNIGIYNKESTIFKNFTYPQIGFLSLITFAGTFLVLNLLKLFGSGFFGLKVLPQQFSPVDSLLVSTLQIPIAEESMAFFALGILILGLTILAIKFNWSKRSFTVYKYTLAFVGMAILGGIWHSTVYSNSSVALLTTSFFWGVKAILGLITGFMLVPILFHMTNNFFIDFTRLYSSDATLGFVFGLLIVFGLIYFYLYRKNGDWYKGADR